MFFGFIHPMHIHGGPFEVVATDGVPVPEGQTDPGPSITPSRCCR